MDKNSGTTRNAATTGQKNSGKFGEYIRQREVE